MKMELWKNDLLPGITFANNSYSHHSFQPHFHDHYTIMIVDKGVNEGVCEKKKYHVTASDILLINPGEIHTGSSYQEKHLHYSALYVYEDFFIKHQLYGQGGSPPVFTKLLERNAGLAERIRELCQCTRAAEDPLEIEEKKVSVFWELMNYNGSKKPEASSNIDRTSVQKIKTFIKEQYKQQFSLANLTDFTGLSPYHLIRSFKQAVGMTPFQFLRNYRIEKAKVELLRKKSIAEVAVEIGFYDQSHFHKHFKLVTGVTPREFQRQ
jgi:AraC-like DNA-binding protein